MKLAAFRFGATSIYQIVAIRFVICSGVESVTSLVGENLIILCSCFIPSEFLAWFELVGKFRKGTIINKAES